MKISDKTQHPKHRVTDRLALSSRLSCSDRLDCWFWFGPKIGTGWTDRMNIFMLDHNKVSGRSKPAAAAGPGLLEGDDEIES